MQVLDPDAGREQVRRRPRCAVVLAGAAGQGAFAAGALHELVARGVRPDTLAATSSGALNALALARGLVAGCPVAAAEELTRLWVDEASLARLARRSISWRGLARGQGVLDSRGLLELMRAAAPLVTEPQQAVTLLVTAAPLAGRSVPVNGASHRTFEAVACADESTLADEAGLEALYRWVAASAAFPFLFVPAEVSELGPALDGGLVNNAPLSLVADAETIYVISSRPADAAPRRPPGGLGLLELVVDMLVNERLLRDLARYAARARVVEIRPARVLPGSALVALVRRDLRCRYVEIGRQCAARILTPSSAGAAGRSATVVVPR